MLQTSILDTKYIQEKKEAFLKIIAPFDEDSDNEDTEKRLIEFIAQNNFDFLLHPEFAGDFISSAPNSANALFSLWCRIVPAFTRALLKNNKPITILEKASKHLTPDSALLLADLLCSCGHDSQISQEDVYQFINESKLINLIPFFNYTIKSKMNIDDEEPYPYNFLMDGLFDIFYSDNKLLISTLHKYINELTVELITQSPDHRSVFAKILRLLFFLDVDMKIKECENELEQALLCGMQLLSKLETTSQKEVLNTEHREHTVLWYWVSWFANKKPKDQTLLHLLRNSPSVVGYEGFYLGQDDKHSIMALLTSALLDRPADIFEIGKAIQTELAPTPEDKKKLFLKLIDESNSTDDGNISKINKDNLNAFILNNDFNFLLAPEFTSEYLVPILESELRDYDSWSTIIQSVIISLLKTNKPLDIYKKTTQSLTPDRILILSMLLAPISDIFLDIKDLRAIHDHLETLILNDFGAFISLMNLETTERPDYNPFNFLTEGLYKAHKKTEFDPLITTLHKFLATFDPDFISRHSDSENTLHNALAILFHIAANERINQDTISTAIQMIFKFDINLQIKILQNRIFEPSIFEHLVDGVRKGTINPQFLFTLLQQVPKLDAIIIEESEEKSALDPKLIQLATARDVFFAALETFEKESNPTETSAASILDVPALNAYQAGFVNAYYFLALALHRKKLDPVKSFTLVPRESNKFDEVQTILKCLNFDPSVSYDDPKRLYEIAIEYDSTTFIKHSREHNMPCPLDYSTITSYIFRFGAVKVLSYLLSTGYNFSIDIPNDGTLVHRLVNSGLAEPNQIEMLKALLKNGHALSPVHFSKVQQLFKTNLKAFRSLTDLGLCIEPTSIKEEVALMMRLNNPEMMDYLLMVSNYHQSSPFVNHTEIQHAALYVHMMFTSNPYTNGSSIHRWTTQRSLALLASGKTIDVPPKYIYGIPEVISLLKQKRTVSLDEIAKEANINKETVGRVKIDQYNFDHPNDKIIKVVHKQNHDLQHLLSVAALILAIDNLYSTNAPTGLYCLLSTHELEILQLMMLFSVIGREDETGFADSNQLGDHLYQCYRAVSAIEYIKYVKLNWERHYRYVYKDFAQVYQTAYVLELMGYPEMPKKENLLTIPFVSILARGFSKKSLKALQQEIKKYAENRLHSYTKSELMFLFPDAPVAVESERSETYLNYMNAAHSLVLMRCRLPGNYKEQYDKSTTTQTLNYFYKQVKDALYYKKDSYYSPAEKVIRLFCLAREILNEFGEKAPTQIERPTELSSTVLNSVVTLEELLIKSTGKRYAEILEEPIGQVTFGVLMENLGLSADVKNEIDYPNGTLDEDQFRMRDIMVRYISSQLFFQGISAYAPNRFDVCCYLPNAFVRDDYRDLRREVNYTMLKLQHLQGMQHFVIRQFPGNNTKEMDCLVKSFKDMCGDGVITIPTDKYVSVIFPTPELAVQFVNALYQYGLIDKLSAPSDTIELTVKLYQLIKPFFKFKIVKPPKHHSTESMLVDAQGKIDAIELFDDINAAITNHNTRKKDKSETGLQHLFSTIESPSTMRDVKVPSLTVAQKSAIMVPTAHEKFRSLTRPLIRTKPLALDEQETIVTDPPSSNYWNSLGLPTARSLNLLQRRGYVDNTTYTKGISTTLAAKSQFTYQPEPAEIFFPVTVIFDRRKMRSYGYKYVWTTNAGTNLKPHLAVMQELLTKEAMKKGTTYKPAPWIPIAKLVEGLKTHNANPQRPTITWNELLLGATKEALAGFSPPCINDKQDNKSVLLPPTLCYKLNVVTQAVNLRNQFGVDVPLVIRDPKGLELLYNESWIIADATEALLALKANTYPYMSNRLRCEEQSVLLEFFEMLSGSKCAKALAMYPSEKGYQPKNDQSYVSFVNECNAHNTAVLTEYLSSLPVNPLNISDYVFKLRLVGGVLREHEYYEEYYDKNKISSDPRALFKRSLALGHAGIAKQIFEDFNLSGPAPEDLLLVIRHGHVACLKFLLNCPSVSLQGSLELISELRKQVEIPYSSRIFQELETLITIAMQPKNVVYLPSQGLGKRQLDSAETEEQNNKEVKMQDGEATTEQGKRKRQKT